MNHPAALAMIAASAVIASTLDKATHPAPRALAAMALYLTGVTVILVLRARDKRHR
jgi:hypothetical protein